MALAKNMRNMGNENLLFYASIVFCVKNKCDFYVAG